jgi:predicted Kef-type K+ transport protein
MILVAFFGGLIATFVRLPPLAGFLAAGFVLNFMGHEYTNSIEVLANLGVTLLLFTIGLKLDVRSLLKAEVWGTATLHMVITSGIALLFLLGLKTVGLALLAQTQWVNLLLISFALSFSSTVFVVKVLEERSESNSVYGRIAVGILIMQDIFAVIFLTASTGKLPSPWAILLLGLVFVAPFIKRLLDRVGHGEMQVLFGFLLALVVGYALFEAVGVKGDLGALVVGMLLSTHHAAPGLAKSLFNIKELLLVAFFLSIGLMAQPTFEHLGWALGLLALLPMKSMLFYFMFPRFGLRKRTTTLASLVLGNYSEFGLIVASLAVGAGWLSVDWLIILSLTVALSFVYSAVANSLGEPIYQRLKHTALGFGSGRLHPHDRPVEIGDAQAIVFGLGRIGRGAYNQLIDKYRMRALGIDNDPLRIEYLNHNYDMNIAEGDASDSDFWEKLVCTSGVELVVLAMPNHHGNVFALKQLKNREFSGRIAAIVQYKDEIPILKELGADATYYVYDGAGQALVDEAMEELLPDLTHQSPSQE